MNIVAHNHVLFSFPSIEVIHLLKLKTPFRIIPPFGYRLSKNRFSINNKWTNAFNIGAVLHSIMVILCTYGYRIV